MAGSIPRFPAQFIARPAHQRFCHQPACFGLAPQEEILHGPFALPPAQPIYAQHRLTGGAHFLGSSSPMWSRVLWITASPYSSGWLKRTELCGRDHAPAIRVLGFLRAIKNGAAPFRPCCIWPLLSRACGTKQRDEDRSRHGRSTSQQHRGFDKELVPSRLCKNAPTS